MSLNAAHKEVAKSAPAYQAAALRSAFSPPPPQTLHDHLALLRDVASALKFARNETIVQEGDPAHYVFRIVSGTVRLCRHTPDGRRHISDFALPGDLFGVFGGSVQAFTAEAVGEVQVVSYPRAHLDRLAEREPRFRANILVHLSAHLLDAQTHTFVLGCRSAKERLASFFIRLAERTGAIDSGRLELAMGRQDIADHLGLTIETICRAVTSLKNDGVIAVPGLHQIVLRNIEALCELAEGGALH